MGNHEVGTVPGTFFLGVLDTILDGGESMKGKDEGTQVLQEKGLDSMNEMVSQLRRCPCNGMIVKS